MRTYKEGFRIKHTTTVTKGRFIELLRTLEGSIAEKCGKKVHLQPEAISEGGILVRCGTESAEAYKSLRFHLKLKHDRKYMLSLDKPNEYRWPTITANVQEEWSGSDEVLFAQNLEGSVFLKAFHGASAWTTQEIRCFAHAFQEAGMTVTRVPVLRRAMRQI
jgi:hypothetical protein